MPTQTQVQQTLLSAQLQMANLVEANRVMLVGGTPLGQLSWDLPKRYYLNIKALQRQYNLGDYTSTGTVAVYDCLVSMIGFDTTVNTIDPTASLPSQTTVTVPVLMNYNQNAIPFSTTSDNPALVFSNYALVYKSLYGNNPTLAIYTTSSGEQEDEGTSPVIVRINPSDVTSDIVSITWPYPIATTGYVLIGGFSPSQTSGKPTGGGANGAILQTYSEANLLQDTNGGWYLPLLLPVGYVPIYVSTNGTSFSPTFDNTVTPNRLYGFANNNTQTILVKVI